ncbi:hypothetical protein GF352_04820 [archaeon]|nr:hypothetical protein [archaeon]
MRKGIIQTVLNVVVALVVVGVIFAASFYVFEIVISSVSGQEVVQGFEDFVEPLSAACNGDAAFSTGVTLPLHSPYTYAVVQTRLRENDKLADTLMRNACVDSYCLCLLRFPKKNYNTWLMSPTSFLGFDTSDYKVTIEGAPEESVVDEPAPMWHFNAPGVTMFPSFIKRVVKIWLMETVSHVVTEIIGYLLTNAICCTGTLGIGCIACFTATTAIYYLFAECVREYLITSFKETTEPIIVVNYPSNFMTTKNPTYLYWTNTGRTFMCDTVARWGSEEALLDMQQALAVANAAAFEGFFRGAFKGLVRGIGATSGLSGDNAWAAGRRLAAYAFVAAPVGVAAASLSIYEKLIYGRVVRGVGRVPVTVPDNIRPKCYVLDLLSARSQIDLSRWMDMGKDYVSVSLQNTYDEDIYELNNVDVLNCVSISDLGPLCDSGTRVMLDYSQDFIYYYRIVDPVNDPLKAIFCEYSQQGKEFNVDLVDTVINSVLDQVPLLPQEIKDVLSTIISELFLAGINSMSGMMIECAVPGNFEVSDPQYFQYWVPYFDSQGITGYDGQIPILEAELVRKNSAEEAACISSVESSWKSCYNKAVPCWENCKDCHEDCSSNDYAYCCSLDAKCNYDKCCVENDYCEYDCDIADRKGENIGCWTDYSEDIEYSFDYETRISDFACVRGFEEVFSPSLELEAAENIKCYYDPCQDKYYRQCLTCISGLHLKPQGVMI